MMSPLDFSNAYKVGERTLSRYQDVCLYGSPELLDNDGEALQVSQMCLSDQYSLGLIAYKIVTGKSLFEGDSIVKILKSRHLFINDKQYRADKLKVFPSGALGQVFIRLLNENPSQRFPNLHEVVKALHPHTHPTKKTRKTDAVRDSYQRCLAINPSLIDDFYKKLYEKLPEIQADFKNPKRQLVMLQMAIDVLIDMDEKRPLLNALMTNTQHQSYTFKKFEDFIGTLIETIKANDPQWTSVESAWEVLRDKTITAIQEARATVE
jgi:hypothetical protein